MTESIIQRYNLTVRGEGTQPILFAHGFGCDQTMWRFIVPAFESNYRVISFDYLGHGSANRSADGPAPRHTYKPERYASLHGYAQDILDICQALDLQRVILVGHSVSCMIGLLACIKEPQRFERLVMVCPSARYINDEQYHGGFERVDIEGLITTMTGNFFGWATSMGPAIMANGDRPHLGEELTRSLQNTDLDIAQQFARVTFFGDNRHDLPNMTVPSLVLQSQDDIITPPEANQYVAQHTPYSTLQAIDARGHCPHLSASGAVAEAMAAYLKAVN